jgi:16S rRNA processing protein RimM
MSSTERLVRAGSVGRPHGLDGAFHLIEPAERLTVGTAVRIGALDTTVERVGGTAERPTLRVSGIASRDDAEAVRGHEVRVAAGELEPDEYLAADLVRCTVAGIGDVRRVVSGPSCDVLEVGDEGVLIPFIRDAIRSIDLATGTIEVDRDFLGLS